MAMSEATKINFLGLENFSLLYITSLLLFHADCFDVLHDLLQHYFTLHAISVATKINFLGLENFCMLHIASTLPFHADCFDVLHYLLCAIET